MGIIFQELWSWTLVMSVWRFIAKLQGMGRSPPGHSRVNDNIYSLACFLYQIIKSKLLALASSYCHVDTFFACIFSKKLWIRKERMQLDLHFLRVVSNTQDKSSRLIPASFCDQCGSKLIFFRSRLCCRDLCQINSTAWKNHFGTLSLWLNSGTSAIGKTRAASMSKTTTTWGPVSNLRIMPLAVKCHVNNQESKVTQTWMALGYKRLPTTSQLHIFALHNLFLAV